MRKINAQPLNTPAWNQWIKDCEEATKTNIEAFKQGQQPSIEPRLYRRREIKDAYFFSRGSPFYGKCAYCEIPISDFQPGDIEHFRPKAAVTDENDKKIVLKDPQGNTILEPTNQPKLHPGYYWLGYEWSNLLPSCAGCNRSGAGNLGKRNRFPVVGNHAQLPGDEKSEKPLLINPASQDDDDDPEKHLFVDPKTGIMGAYSDRGKMCITIFGLNQRDQLRIARQQARDRIRAILGDITKPAIDLNEANPSLAARLKQIVADIDKLINIMEGKEACTMAARAAWKERNLSVEFFRKQKQDIEKALLAFPS